MGVHDRVNFGRQPASRLLHVLFIIARDASSVLTHTHDVGIDHMHGRIMGCGQCIRDLVSDAGLSPVDAGN
jgi:hypothetical protein